MFKLILLSAMCIAGCAPSIPLSESIMFPDNEHFKNVGSDLITAGSFASSWYQKDIKNFSLQKFGPDTLFRDLKYFNPQVNCGIAVGWSSSPNFAVAMNAGFGVLQADMTLRLIANNYFTAIGSVDKSYEMILQNKLNSRLAIGVFRRVDQIEAIQSGWPPFFKFASDRRLPVKSYGLRMAVFTELGNHGIHGAISGGYSPTMKTVMINVGILFNSWRRGKYRY